MVYCTRELGSPDDHHCPECAGNISPTGEQWLSVPACQRKCKARRDELYRLFMQWVDQIEEITDSMVRPPMYVC